MKYGLLVNEQNSNLGDDIQAYAESRFLPRVDMVVDREKLDTFQYGDGTEPVALIMGAWFMWRKFHWPPCRQLVPLFVGYHNFDRRKDPTANSYAIPITHEHYEGIGGQYMKDFGPVGCRDSYTVDVMKEVGIPAYFSGCVTLTLPQQPKTADAGTYVVFVDLNKEVADKLRGIIGDRYEIREITHTTPNIAGATWEERKQRVEEYLTVYQNAKYVVTRRLHVSLPCLAMGTPVCVIQSVEMNDPHRFDPYKEWLHFCTNNKFLKEGYPDFDFINGTPNKGLHLETRAALEKTMTEFAEYCEANKDKGIEFFDKRSFTPAEENAWRVRFMAKTLDRTHKESKAMQQELLELRKENARLRQGLGLPAKDAKAAAPAPSAKPAGRAKRLYWRIRKKLKKLLKGS